MLSNGTTHSQVSQDLQKFYRFEMKFTTLLFPAVVLGAACPYGTFKPEEPTDIRGVCPMLNALANHGFLPRDGKNINENQTVNALNSALNLTPDFGRFLFTAGRLSNPKPNATTFDLNHLDRHGLFEHDGSLSRQDAYFGQWSRFNQTVWNWTKQYYHGDTLDVQMVANSRAQRHMRSNLTNPEYGLTEVGYQFSVAENSALLSIIGDKVTQTCPLKYVDYLFVNERLPYEVGWKKPEVPIELQDLIKTFRKIANASLQGYEQYLYKQSPLELALTATASKDGGSTPVAMALLCISQFADIILHLEANPRALEKTATCRNIMVGTCTGLVTAAAVSCCTNLTEVLSIADDIVEIAFNIGLEAEKRSGALEPFQSSPEQPYTWATVVHNTDASDALRAMDNLDVPSHAKVYASAFGKSTLTVSGPPSTMSRLFDQGGFLEGCEKSILPISAAFHAKHLDPVAWDQLIGNTKPSLLSMNVEHPYVVSPSSGDFLQGGTFIDLLMQVCEDVLQRPIALEAITKGLERHLTDNVSYVSFGPKSIAHAIESPLPARAKSLPQPKQPGISPMPSEAGSGSSTAVDPCDIAIIGMGIRLPGERNPRRILERASRRP
ncbi:hypothetical protein NUW58_g6364 [Xylaria curta]|uniref:Uncharacterized protein n=1 Tax=Xylaria curta TaxID=42375 RepID=A0ACC1NVK3_9PEZI|nr:hypothetical protein NUW58_g6364 [Xylaria curta]